jgi:hypothetical protein
LPTPLMVSPGLGVYRAGSGTYLVFEGPTKSTLISRQALHCRGCLNDRHGSCRLDLPTRLYACLNPHCQTNNPDQNPRTVPATTKWLTPTEKAFLQARLPRSSPRAAEENFVFKEVLRTLRDRRLWLFTFCWAFQTCGSGGVKFYQPTIIANMGFR